MGTLSKIFTPKVISALVAGVLAVVGNLYPDYLAPLAAVAGILVGKEYLPQSNKSLKEDSK